MSIEEFLIISPRGDTLLTKNYVGSAVRPAFCQCLRRCWGHLLACYFVNCSVRPAGVGAVEDRSRGAARRITCRYSSAFMEILLQHMYDEIRCISTCHAGHTLFLFAGLCASVLYQARVGSVWAAACACSSMVFVSARMLVSSLTSHRYDSRIITDRNFAELLNVR